MQPGMPQGFGDIEGKPYFGLPGNPVSVFVSFEMFVRPALMKMMGRRQLFRPEVPATLTAEDRPGPAAKTQSSRGSASRADQGGLDGHAHRGPRLQPDRDRREGERPRDVPPGTETARAGEPGQASCCSARRRTERCRGRGPGRCRGNPDRRGRRRSRDRPRGGRRVHRLDDAGGLRPARGRYDEGAPDRGGQDRRRDGRQAHAGPACRTAIRSP